MTELEKKRILAKTMEKIEQEKISENVQQKSNRWKVAGKVAAAALAVVLVGTAGTKAAAALGLDSSIRNFFGIQTQEETKNAEKLISTPQATAADNGTTISTSQMIGDHTRLYAVLKAKNLPDVPGELELDIPYRGRCHDKRSKQKYPAAGCQSNVERYPDLAAFRDRRLPDHKERKSTHVRKAME